MGKRINNHWFHRGGIVIFFNNRADLLKKGIRNARMAEFNKIHIAVIIKVEAITAYVDGLSTRVLTKCTINP